MELLVARARRAEGELLHPVAREAGVRVAVDEAGDRRETASVELLDVAFERPELPHLPDGAHAAVLAEDVAVLDHVDEPERLAAQWRGAAGRRRDLSEIADQQARGHSAPLGRSDGRSSSCSRAVSSASA